jgi:hypothetical protein
LRPRQSVQPIRISLILGVADDCCEPLLLGQHNRPAEHLVHCSSDPEGVFVPEDSVSSGRRNPSAKATSFAFEFHIHGRFATMQSESSVDSKADTSSTRFMMLNVGLKSKG